MDHRFDENGFIFGWVRRRRIAIIGITNPNNYNELYHIPNYNRPINIYLCICVLGKDSLCLKELIVYLFYNISELLHYIPSRPLLNLQRKNIALLLLLLVTTTAPHPLPKTGQKKKKSERRKRNDEKRKRKRPKRKKKRERRKRRRGRKRRIRRRRKKRRKRRKQSANLPRNRSLSILREALHSKGEV